MKELSITNKVSAGGVESCVSIIFKPTDVFKRQDKNIAKRVREIILEYIHDNAAHFLFLFYFLSGSRSEGKSVELSPQLSASDMEIFDFTGAFLVAPFECKRKNEKGY